MKPRPALSLLEQMIARLTTQQRLLDEAMRLIATVDGPLLEVGLGKGRTFDYLRRRMPERTIYAFDRDLHAPPLAAPDAAHLFLGEFSETLAAVAKGGRITALAHADFGSPDRVHDAQQAKVLGALLQPLMRPGGIVLSDRELNVEGWSALPIDPLPSWPYHLWRVDS